MAHDRPSPVDADRFKRVAWPHLSALLRTARYFAHSDTDAEDLVQETMLKAMRSLDRYQDGTDAKAWLMTILRNTHLDVLRVKKRRGGVVSIEAAQLDPPAKPDLGEEDDAEDPTWHGVDPDELLGRFTDQSVADAIGELPDELRWTVLLVDVERFEHRQAAQMLGVPEGTIKSRAFRGRRLLRQRLMGLAKARGWVTEDEGSRP